MAWIEAHRLTRDDSQEATMSTGVSMDARRIGQANPVRTPITLKANRMKPRTLRLRKAFFLEERPTWNLLTKPLAGSTGCTDRKARSTSAMALQEGHERK
jgi:hypothetical protein